MKTIVTLPFILVFLLFCLMGCTKSPTILVEDDFKNGANGWTIVGDAKGDTAEPTYYETGGVSNGYIYAEDDVTGGIWYFSASDRYKGTQKDFYGATLKFSLYQDSKMAKPAVAEDVVLKSGDKKIYHRIAQFPDSTWTHYTLRIEENSGWRIKNNREATEGEIREILDNITDFWIRGEYETGEDAGGLDNVHIEK